MRAYILSVWNVFWLVLLARQGEPLSPLWHTVGSKASQNLQTTTTSSIATPAGKTTCLDMLPDCADYGSPATVCHGSFLSWAEQYCRRYCNYCSVSTTLSSSTEQQTKRETQTTTVPTSTTILSTTESPTKRKTLTTTAPTTTTTISPSKIQSVSSKAQFTTKQCFDRMQNCANYGSQSYACTGVYKTWAEEQCAAYCGFCGKIMSTSTSSPRPLTTMSTDSLTPPAISRFATLKHNGCTDKLHNCYTYGDPSYACNDQFKEWARVNCASYCNLCGTEMKTTLASRSTPTFSIQQGTNVHHSHHESSHHMGLFSFFLGNILHLNCQRDQDCSSDQQCNNGICVWNGLSNMFG